MSDRMKKRKKSGKIKWIVLPVLLLTFAGAFLFVMQRYTVRTVYVTGNIHYTEDEIKEIVMKGPFGNNSLYLSMRYRDKGVENIPFVDAMDVEILSPDTIEITVYEKALAGYIKYMDSYMYFNREGYVVECSDTVTQGVPQVTGLKFNYVVLGERIPVEDPEIFTSIMDLTKLLDKYELQADKIFFHSTEDVTLYFGDIKVALGNDSKELENKVRRLPQLLAKVEGQSGTFRMENLTDDKTGITFQVNGQ